MAKLSDKEKKIVEDLIEVKVGEIWRYRNLINALVAIYEYFNKKSDYACYLGATLDGKKPDVVIKSKNQNKVDIIGDGKNGTPGLRLKKDDEEWDAYLKSPDVVNYMTKILDDLNKQIEKYSVKLENITEPHDFFTLCPNDKKNGIKLLQRDERLNKKAIILTFSFTQQETKYVLRVEKELGTFVDVDINNQFELQSGLFHIMQDSAELMSKHKLYVAEKEDYNAPIEWIMLVIWQYILPELAQTNSKEMVIATLKNGFAVIEVTLKQISDFIKDNYQLPTFNGQKTSISFDVIKKALKNLEKLTEVQVLNNTDVVNPKYRIIWKKLSGETLLHDFVKKIHEEEFIQKAKQEAAKAEPIQSPPSQQKLTDLEIFSKK